MSYHCRFDVPGLPRLQGKVHWSVTTRDRKRWREITRWEIRAARIQTPQVPLSRAELTFTRHSSMRPDSDNLAASFKPIRDALIGLLIEDDSHQVVGDPLYRWEQAPPRRGWITVEVQAVTR